MKVLLFIFCCLVTTAAFAQERWIDMEWEAVPGAKEYELELYQNVSGTDTPRGKYKVDTSAWSHSVTPGKYSIRIRSLDTRGVPGEWSELIPLKVRLRNPQLLRPVPGDQVSDMHVNLEWGEIEGAGQYQVVVKGPNGKVVSNSIVKELKTNIFLDDVGSYSWTVLALEAEEGSKDSSEWAESSFRTFARASSELDAPAVSLNINEKFVLLWHPVRNAQKYEVDYFPPAGQGDKNRRFQLKQSPFVLKRENFKQGATTLTVKAIAPSFQDSRKSVIKLSKSGEKLEVEDIIQGKAEEPVVVDPSSAQWKHQYFVSLVTGRYAYDSTQVETDTTLKQKKLTTLGVNVDYHWQPRLNSLMHKFSFSTVNFSNGIDSGRQLYAAYLVNAVRSFLGGRIHYGGGAGYLQVPSFMGDRFIDEVEIEHTSGYGPEANVAWYKPLSASWILEAQLQYLYVMQIMSSDRKKEESFSLLKSQLVLQKYFTKKEAFMFGVDYRSWDQKWGKDSSAISGLSFVLGIKGSF